MTPFLLCSGPGVYRTGYTANLLASTVTWSTYFALYAGMKQHVMKNAIEWNGPVGHFASAAMTSLVTVLWTNPLWTVKTRLCCQQPQRTVHNIGPQGPLMYRGLREEISQVYRFLNTVFISHHDCFEFLQLLKV